MKYFPWNSSAVTAERGTRKAEFRARESERRSTTRRHVTNLQLANYLIKQQKMNFNNLSVEVTPGAESLVVAAQTAGFSVWLWFMELLSHSRWVIYEASSRTAL